MIGLILIYTTIILVVLNYLKLLYKWKCCVKIIKSMNKNVNNQNETVKSLKQFPGPAPLPIIGNLNLLAYYDVPFEAFSVLTKTYGDVYNLTFGSTRCLIVNNLDLIREVLNQNGKYFLNRPDFIRFHRLFGGNRNNSMAFCDWSNLQQKRRNLARKHCSPRDMSAFHQKMNDVGCIEVQKCMDRIKTLIKPNDEVYLKSLIMETCANMFCNYMCSIQFNYDDIGFKNMVNCFDEIFWEINQGYAVDFLPWLNPFYTFHMKKLEFWAQEIRTFILNRIIDVRNHELDYENEERDFVDALLKHLKNEDDVTMDTIIFMLEDFIGGHSAIGNLVILTLGCIAKKPEIGKRIQDEVDKITGNGVRKISLDDIKNAPFTIATIFEVLRYCSSPIVPHVAVENCSIAGHGILKDTVVFINNYELNTNEAYWERPKEFEPERFLECVSNNHKNTTKDSKKGRNNNTISSTTQVFQVRKNIPHFLPFSTGKRTCVGQNLVRDFSFLILSNILQKYDVSSNDISTIKIYAACVALPSQTYPLKITHRN